MRHYFSENELNLIADALNGVCCSPSTFIGNIKGALEWEDLGAKHNVDTEKLLALLSKLSVMEIAKLHAAIEEYWNAGVVYDSKKRFIDVGLLEM